MIRTSAPVAAAAIIIFSMFATAASAGLTVTDWGLTTETDADSLDNVYDGASVQVIDNLSYMVVSGPSDLSFPFATTDTVGLTPDSGSTAASVYQFAVTGDTGVFSLAFEHHFDAGPFYDARSTGELSFTVSADSLYNLDGVYSMFTDEGTSGAPDVIQVVSLQDMTYFNMDASIPPTQLYLSSMESHPTGNQVFTLGQPAQPAPTEDNTVTGALQGQLLAGHTYLFGYEYSIQSSGGSDVNVTAANANGNLHLGITPQCITAPITGSVACTFEGQSTPISNATLIAFNSDNEPAGTATTAADGTYTITDLSPGDYTVHVTSSDEMKACSQDTVSVTVTCQGGRADFCICPCSPSAITGTVACTHNGQNTPVGGAAVAAFDPNDVQVGSAATASDGTYTISNLIPGEYTVQITPPFGTKTCSLASVGVTLSCEQNGTANFCVCPCNPSAITGSVACTLSGQTTPVESVTVAVLNANNAQVGSAVTATDGTYAIGGLSPGTYAVQVTPPAGTKTCTPASVSVALACEQNGAANFCVCPCTPSAITGSVACTLNGQKTAVANVAVTAFDVNNNQTGAGVTAGDGTYSIGGLPPGVYNVVVTPPPATKTCTPVRVTVTLPCEQNATADFCVCPCNPSAIIGTVACTQNGQHTPVASAVLTVLDSNNNPIGSATSAQDGSYSIPGLMAGAYAVTVTPPAGMKVCSLATQALTLVCEQDGVADFCVCPCDPSSVSGSVTCTRAGQTSPLGNAAIAAFDGSNNVVGSTTTASDGTYTIAGLLPRSYTITVTPPSNTKPCGPTSIPVTLQCERNMTANFCVCSCLPSSITGSVTCMRGGQVTPLASVAVSVFDSNNAQAGVTTTGADGSYAINGLVAGAYTVAATPPGNSYTCAPIGVSLALTCEENGTANFCICPCLPSSITGAVNCLRNGQTVPLSNVTLTVFDSNQAQVATAATASDGIYTVGGLSPGAYSVTVTPPVNTKPCGDITVPVTLLCEQSGSANFCVCPCLPSAITGSVACTSGGQPSGVGNVTVTALDNNSAQVGTATTASDGSYTIPGLSPGSYVVQITPPANTVTCSAPSVAVELTCEQDGTASFCVCPCAPSAISGSVSCTLNAQTAPVGSVAVTAFDGNNSAAGTATTAADGTYTIPGLNPGAYVVRVAPPVGMKTCTSASLAVTLSCQQNGTASFCVCPCDPVTVTGSVTCTRGGQSTPVSGTVITVFDGNNAQVGTSTSASDGSYSVSGLNPGNYTVTVTPLPGTKACGSTSTAITIACEQSSTVNFCLCPCLTSNVSGTVTCNRDGQVTPIANAKLTAYDSTNTLAGTAASGSDGGYTISGLGPDSYSIQVTPPPNAKACLGTTAAVTLGCEQNGTANFCVCPCLPSAIAGSVTCTLNGQITPVANVTVTVYDASNAQAGTATSGSDGSYSINTLNPGNYNVVVTPPAGMTTCTPSSVPVALGCEQNGKANFCVCPCNGSVVGSITCTQNGQNTPVANVAVNVYASGNQLVGSAISAADGKYTISGLAPGSYTAKVTVPPNTQTCGQISASVTLTCDQKATANFCLCPVCHPASVSGSVTCTQNGQTLPAPNVTVAAFLNNSQVGSAATCANGTYTIGGLASGSYVIKVTPPANSQSCGPTSVNLSLACAQAGTVNFCICPCTTPITGSVACTQNGQNTPVANVTVTAYQTGMQVGSAVTGSNGAYSIAGLLVGTYTVKLTPPANVQSCGPTSVCLTTSCGQNATANFCICPCSASVSGTIKCTQNGQCGGGSSTPTPVPNVTVTAYQSNLPVGSAVSGNDGSYTITGLAAGSYAVKVTLPANSQSCSSTTTCLTLSCGQNATANFCVCPCTAVVNGVVACMKGCQSTPMQNVTVVASQNGLQAGSAVTARDGTYTISGLTVGYCVVKITPPANTQSCGSTSANVTLACSQTATANFCLCPACGPATVTGTVTCNANGQAAPQANVTITAYNSNNVAAGVGVTGDAGQYTISKLASGSYTLKATLPANTQSCGASSSCLVLGCSQTATANFCVCPCSSSISGAVTCNKQGCQSAPVANVTVTAYANNQATGSAVTGSNGAYTISGLPLGSYTVKATLPSNTQSCGSSSACVNLSCGQNGTADFCICPTCPRASIAGKVACTASGGTTPLANVKVTAYLNNAAVGSAVTGSDGAYAMTGLATGSYTITVSVPANAIACGSTCTSATLACGQTATVNFCVCAMTGTGCTRTPGYWKNHQSAWPVQSLIVGGVSYNASQMQNFLNNCTPSGQKDANNVSVKLAMFNVSAKCSLLSGATPSNILPILANSDTYLAAHPPGSKPTGADLTTGANLQTQLDNYCNQFDCP